MYTELSNCSMYALCTAERMDGWENQSCKRLHSFFLDLHFLKASVSSIFHIIALFTFFPVIVSYKVVCLFHDISLNARAPLPMHKAALSDSLSISSQDISANTSADTLFQNHPLTLNFTRQMKSSEERNLKE